MKTFIDPSEIKALGLGLSEEQETALMKALQPVFEQRIAIALMELLDEKSAEELKKLAEANNPPVLGEWIESHVPDYQDVIDDEYDILIGDIMKDPMQFLK